MGSKELNEVCIVYRILHGKPLLCLVTTHKYAFGENKELLQYLQHIQVLRMQHA